MYLKSGANGAITGDMLTTQGITIAEDQRIIKQLGFRVAKPWLKVCLLLEQGQMLERHM